MLSAHKKFGTIWVKTVGVVPEQTNKQTETVDIYIDRLYVFKPYKTTDMISPLSFHHIAGEVDGTFSSDVIQLEL